MLSWYYTACCFKDKFGYYAYQNSEFGCNEYSSSTTNWWLEQEVDTSHINIYTTTDDGSGNKNNTFEDSVSDVYGKIILFSVLLCIVFMEIELIILFVSQPATNRAEQARTQQLVLVSPILSAAQVSTTGQATAPQQVLMASVTISATSAPPAAWASPEGGLNINSTEKSKTMLQVQAHHHQEHQVQQQTQEVEDNIIKINV